MLLNTVLDLISFPSGLLWAAAKLTALPIHFPAVLSQIHRESKSPGEHVHKQIWIPVSLV